MLRSLFNLTVRTHQTSSFFSDAANPPQNIREVQHKLETLMQTLAIGGIGTLSDKQRLQKDIVFLEAKLKKLSQGSEEIPKVDYVLESASMGNGPSL